MHELSVLENHAITISLPTQVENPAISYLIGLGSSHSRQTMRSNLNTIAKILGQERFEDIAWGTLRRGHVQLVHEHLRQKKRSPATINTYLAAMKGVAREAWLKEQMDTTSYQMIKELKPARGTRLNRGRALKSTEISKLFAVCHDDLSVRGIRDAAMLAILLGCGLRRSELIQLTFSDYQPEESFLYVLGKGNKERRCFLPQQSLTYLNRWIEEVRGEYHGPLFTRIRRYGDVTEEKMTSQAVYHVMDLRRQQANIAPFAPHDLRRTFASMLLENGEDLATVKDAMGHASVTTTQQYDKRGEQRLQRASQRVTF